MSQQRRPAGNYPPNVHAPAPFTEYKLKMSPMAVSHNVMALHSSTAKLADFTQPVRMIRDPNSGILGPIPEASEPGAASSAYMASKVVAGGRNPLSGKKRSRLIFADEPDEELERLRTAEVSPWLLEDYDGQHSFVGKLEGGQGSNYVFFVNQGDEFRIIPVSKWYRFCPKLSYHTLTLEEAEQAVKSRESEMDRWLMKHRAGGSSIGGSRSASDTERPLSAPDEKASLSSASKPGSLQGKARLAARVLNREAGAQPHERQAIPSQGRRRLDDDQEEIDFDEIFDDDEGNDSFGGLDDEEGGERRRRPAGTKTNRLKGAAGSSEGKLMRKIVRHLDKQNRDNLLFSDDEEELDPYASDQDESDEDMSSVTTSTANQDLDKLSLKDEKAPAATGGTAVAKQAKPLGPPSKATSPVQSPTPSFPGSPAASRAATPQTSPKKAASADTTITEADIIGFLKQGPMSTKDLIAKFKRQLKADPKNKDIFRELVRKLAMVRASPVGGDEDKLLELKPEFK
jgi:hypothetical protein